MLAKWTTAACLLVSAFGVAGPAHAQKQFSGITLNVNGYGGAYDDILKETVAKPLKEKFGLEVVYQPSGSTSATARLLASRNDPPYDILMADSPAMPGLIEAGVLEEITAAEVPATARVFPQLREFGNYGLPFSIASVALVSNRNLVKTPPKSIKDLARPEYKGKVALISLESSGGILSLMAMAESAGGGVNDADPGFKVLQTIKPNLLSAFGATVPQLQAFQQEEAAVGIFWNGRIYELQTKGAPVDLIVPEEGIYSLSSYVNAVKGSKHRAAQMAYLEQALSDEAIAALAIKFTYGPTTPVKLPDEIAGKVITYGPEGLKKVKTLDWAAVAKNRGAWVTQWNKEMR
ncbi:spermidine/putrescine-binding protein [Stella humosa]|uniref:Spermidine/putrescine-binding protein n=1 Tax=Stella humosa TaxID=94 RepID=A0A3N1KT15_9PROT|nr:extracellular solute-binding protein [Stella humosa]ROP83134.1 spermidine/putrescine-binding protein [Stella humosa]BBK30089.1 ABC transporter substrate-binding protein [Stella humosa]